MLDDTPYSNKSRLASSLAGVSCVSMQCEEQQRSLQDDDPNMAAWVQRALFMKMSLESAGKPEFQAVHQIAQAGLRSWNEKHG